MKGIKKVKFFDNFDTERDLDSLVLNKRQVSNICAVLIFLFMLVFSLGYFWGKKNATEGFVDKAVNDSFEDKINYSLYSLYNNSNQEEDIIVEEAAEEPQAAIKPAKEPEVEQPVVEAAEEDRSRSGPMFYAELVGFGTEKAANSFLEKTKVKGYPVKIVAKKSTSPKGKTVTWYQAVTEKQQNKGELEKLTNQIEKSERLSGTRIIKVKS